MGAFAVPAERTALNTAERVGYVAVTLRRDERAVSQLRNSTLSRSLLGPRIDMSNAAQRKS